MIFLTEPVIGICRLSFCGRGEALQHAYAFQQHGDSDQPDNMLSRWFSFLGEGGASCHDALMRWITSAAE